MNFSCCVDDGTVSVFSYTTEEIHFNLMAVVADRKKLYEQEIEELSQKRDMAAQRVIMDSSTYMCITPTPCNGYPIDLLYVYPQPPGMDTLYNTCVYPQPLGMDVL